MTRTQFLSDEEYWFACWLIEMQSIGLVDSWEYEPEPFFLAPLEEQMWVEQLKTKTIVRSKQLYLDITYQCDFKIEWNPGADGIIFYGPYRAYTKEEKRRCLFYVNQEQPVSYIEIKPDFDYRNMTRYATTKIHWVKAKHNINVQIVKIPSFFKKIFAPNEFYLTPNGAERTKRLGKKFYPLRSFNEYSTKTQWHDRIHCTAR
jgi:hypothetical protein